MEYSLRLLTLMIATFALSACADMPALIQWHDDEDKPAYIDNGQQRSSVSRRAPLDIPPELRGDVKVPSPDAIAVSDGSVPALRGAAKKAVAGQAVALDAKLYDQDAATVFSASIDAMTALNLPVQSVDSPSGTLTTDWVRQDSASQNASLFGGGEQAVRYRFVVRVLRQSVEDADKTRLEIRTIGQVFINRHWVNRPLKRKVADELFTAVEERL